MPAPGKTDKIPVQCTQCGHWMAAPLAYAGRTARCTKCGGGVIVPDAPGADPKPEPTGPDALLNDVASFGAYGKAADAAWKDPTQNTGAMLEVPPEILERHQQRLRRRQRLMINVVIYVSIAGALILGMIILQGGLSDDPPAAPAAESAAPAPEAAPAPATADPPVTIPAYDPQATVYGVAGAVIYHLESCPIYQNAAAERHYGSVAEAVAAGYTPCQQCNPPAPPPAAISAPPERAAP